MDRGILAQRRIAHQALHELLGHVGLADIVRQVPPEAPETWVLVGDSLRYCPGGYAAGRAATIGLDDLPHVLVTIHDYARCIRTTSLDEFFKRAEDIALPEQVSIDLQDWLIEHMSELLLPPRPMPKRPPSVRPTVKTGW